MPDYLSIATYERLEEIEDHTKKILHLLREVPWTGMTACLLAIENNTQQQVILLTEIIRRLPEPPGDVLADSVNVETTETKESPK